MERETWKSFALRSALPCLLAVAAAFVARYQLELSDGLPAAALAAQWPLYAPLNALTAFCLTLVLFALLGRWSRATGISGAVFTVLALVNYYTRDLHGSALMPQDVLNLGTAAEVMGSYTLQITKTVAVIALLYLPVLAAAWVQARLAAPAPKRPSWKRRALRAAGSAAAAFAILYIGYFSPWPVCSAEPFGWTWQDTYSSYGYLAGTIGSASLLRDPVIRPEGYTDAAAAQTAAVCPGEEVLEQQYPDIVMILSESFYDFSLVTDLQEDTDIFPVTANLTNAVLGHTVSPHVGGGTNPSEYEMLSSNSMMLTPSITPFNWLDLQGANSFVSYVRELGYATLAAHPYTSSNYRRDAAWRDLGFDEIHFEEDFPVREYYGQRPYLTDSAAYQGLEALYEAMPEDRPRYLFLVSIQSHGDYDMNAPELDLVHAGTDYGSYDAVMDEYLSCMRLSDEAVGELCSYFTRVYERTGRRVVVAMAGDHAPSFVDHVADKSLAAPNDLQILERSTPFFIWANYPLTAADEAVSGTDPLNRMDLCFFAPTVARQAGLPLTSFYQYLLEMKKVTPVVTAGNDYMSADGVTHTYGENPAADRWVQGYFYLEYNNIGSGARREQPLFCLR